MATTHLKYMEGPLSGYSATNYQEGLQLISKHSFDLIVLMINREVGKSSYQFILECCKTSPEARILALVELQDGFGARFGVLNILSNQADVRQIVKTAVRILDNELVYPVRELELIDFVALFYLSGLTALLHIKVPDNRGRIVFNKGEVIHVELNDQVGKEAFIKLMETHNGNIFVQYDFHNPKPTLNCPFLELLGIARYMISNRFKSEDEILELTEMIVSEDDISLEYLSYEKLPPIPKPVFVNPPTEKDSGSDKEIMESKLLFLESLDLMEIDDETSDLLNSSVTENDSDSLITEIDRTSSDIVERPVQPDMVITDSEAGGIKAEDYILLTKRKNLEDTNESSQTVLIEEPTNSFLQLFENLSRDIPGYLMSLIFDLSEGISLFQYSISGRELPKELSQTLADLVNTLEEGLDIYGTTTLDEVVMTGQYHYLLMRIIPGTPFFHIVVINKTGNLGLAKVTMKRYEEFILNVLS